MHGHFLFYFSSFRDKAFAMIFEASYAYAKILKGFSGLGFMEEDMTVYQTRTHI